MSEEQSKQVQVTQASQSQELDGFSGFVEYGGGKRTFEGTKIKFTTEATWIDASGQEITGPLVAVDVLRRVCWWIGGDLVKAEILAPKQAWPDISALNEQEPKENWRMAFGKHVGPVQGEHVVLLVNFETMERYWWPSPIDTIGSAIAVHNLVDQVALMRKFRGQNVFPVVELSHTFMSTNYGGRERPLLQVIDWKRFGPNGTAALPEPKPAPAVEASSTPTTAAEAPAVAPEKQPESIPRDHGFPKAEKVMPPTTAEILNDEIPWK